MGARRGYAAALLAVAGGGALALVAAAPGWVVATNREVGYDTTFGGSQVAPGLVACALVALAGAVAVIASRGWARRVVGMLLGVIGLVVAGLPLRVVLDPAGAVRSPLAAVTGGTGAAIRVVEVAWWWPGLAAVGGLLVLAGAAATVVRSDAWPVMAARYDAPAGSRRRGAAAADPWALLDRGEDPTLDPAPAEPSPDLPQ
jgi:uncharacterized membrane protein (TIGR02234 family)